ncbi:hypothetical protein BD311DRAFT_661764 [Dichomitus squalens]|uniref:Uncharacterized protein n=1 Tax=Dichomitus squalens TaxID=114155 RepID=A0A4Q9MSJ7_9APHY|nr:hypothetical protein BD311DRAFT_661764 [Dichomitus squalens]
MQGNHGQSLTQSGLRPAAISGPPQGQQHAHIPQPGGSAPNALSASQQAHAWDLHAEATSKARQGGYQQVHRAPQDTAHQLRAFSTRLTATLTANLQPDPALRGLRLCPTHNTLPILRRNTTLTTTGN